MAVAVDPDHPQAVRAVAAVVPQVLLIGRPLMSRPVMFYQSPLARPEPGVVVERRAVERPRRALPVEPQRFMRAQNFCSWRMVDWVDHLEHPPELVALVAWRARFEIPVVAPAETD